MKILVINAGSSSLKFTAHRYDNETVLAKGVCVQVRY
jgi:acetate kinase